MPQTPEGALKVAAKAAKISVEEFVSRRASGLKRCWRCDSWKAVADFSNDKHRPDGKKADCLTCNRVKVKVDRKGQSSAFKGRTHTAAAKAKISAVHKGKISPNKGKKMPPEFGKRVSEALRNSPNVQRGVNHYGWKDGASVRTQESRRAPKYRDWRLAVFTRDKFTCTRCGDAKGGNLEAHHIKPFAAHPELRFDVENGITLCTACHMIQHYKADSIRNRRKRKRGERLWI